MKKYKIIILALVLFILVGGVTIYIRNTYTPNDNIGLFTRYDGEESYGFIFVNGVRLEDVYFHNTGIEGTPYYVPLHRIVWALGGAVGFTDGFTISPGPGVVFSRYGHRITIHGLKGESIVTVGCSIFFILNQRKEIELGHPVKEIYSTVYVPVTFFIDIFGVDNVTLEDGNMYIYSDEVGLAPPRIN